MTCEDFPCCGHASNDCPRNDSSSGFLPYPCIGCGENIPKDEAVRNHESFCRSCINDPRFETVARSPARVASCARTSPLYTANTLQARFDEETLAADLEAHERDALGRPRTFGPCPICNARMEYGDEDIEERCCDACGIEAQRGCIDACPGCGCRSGEGRTPGCVDPEGCGYSA